MSSGGTELRERPAAGYNDSWENTHNISEGDMRELQAQDRWSRDVNIKVEAVVWVVLAYFTMMKSDIIRVILYDAEVHTTYLNLALILFCISCVIAGYLIIVKRHMQGIDDWQESNPTLIGVATVIGLVQCVAFNVAIWPLYGWWSPVISFLLFMGFLNIFHFVPNF